MEQRTSVIKKKILKVLCNNEEIRSLVVTQPDLIEYPEDLIGVNIFPYLKVDFTPQETGAYIGVSVNFPSINTNEIFKNMYLVFLIICHDNFMNISAKNDNGACRTDLIAEQILNAVNWNDLLGCDLKLVSDKEDPMNKNYYSRELVFRTATPNSMKDGVKVNV